MEIRYNNETSNNIGDDRKLIEVLSSVIYKLSNGQPMMTAKEEVAEDFVKDWVELFGWEAVQ